jgi:hypothetical protein
MKRHFPARVSLFVTCLCLLFSAGCANYLKPETGAVALPEARIAIPEQGLQNQAFQAGDVRITYALAGAREPFSLTGVIDFSSSLTNSYPTVTKFVLTMSYLDGNGKVIEAIDISPVLHYYSQVTTADIRVSRPAPPGCKAIAFNYFGIFRQTGKDDNGEWEIFYFPFK